jgi:hypothetical protein
MVEAEVRAAVSGASPPEMSVGSRKNEDSENSGAFVVIEELFSSTICISFIFIC